MESRYQVGSEVGWARLYLILVHNLQNTKRLWFLLQNSGAAFAKIIRLFQSQCNVSQFQDPRACGRDGGSLHFRVVAALGASGLRAIHISVSALFLAAATFFFGV